MTIFALDASGLTAGVCVLQDGQTAYEELVDEGLTHSQTLLPLAARAFGAVGLQADEVDLYAVTVGPGSFTGLRIGLATVKGLALPAGVPVAPISTLEAWAAGCEQEGTLLPALDARRGEVYWAAFGRAGGRLARLHADSADSAKVVAETAQGFEQPLLLIGDGAQICYNAFKDAGIGARMGAHSSVALGAARLAQRSQATNAAAVRPQYLRLSQAQRERAERLQKENKQT